MFIPVLSAALLWGIWQGLFRQTAERTNGRDVTTFQDFFAGELRGTDGDICFLRAGDARPPSALPEDRQKPVCT